MRVQVQALQQVVRVVLPAKTCNFLQGRFYTGQDATTSDQQGQQQDGQLMPDGRHSTHDNGEGYYSGFTIVIVVYWILVIVGFCTEYFILQ